MGASPINPVIWEYIHAHQDRFGREAITSALLKAGHSQEAIDAAFDYQPNDEPIRAYIEANRANHTRAAINAQLRQAGHDPQVIERAWLAPGQRASRISNFWPIACLTVMIVSFGLVGICVAAVALNS